MDVAEFERIVRIGLGRAILHLQTHDPAPYRDVILEATLHNWQYSASDESHERYLLDLIELTGDVEFFRNEILRSLDDLAARDDPNFEFSSESVNARQLCALARLLALKGDSEAHQAIRRMLASQPARDYLVYELLELEAEHAVPFIANILGAKLSSDDETPDWVCAHVVSLFQTHFEDDRAWEILTAASKDDPNVAAFVAAVEADRAEPPWGKPRPEPQGLDYDEILSGMTVEPWASYRSPSPWRLWGKSAEDDQLSRAAEAMLAMSDDDPLLLRHVQLFNQRAFPFDPQRLIDLANHGRDVDTFDRTTSSREDLLAVDALFALEHVRHPLVRDFALELKSNNQWSGWSTDILLANFEDGDLDTINTHIQRTTDFHDLHSMVMALWSFYKENRPSGIEETMLLCYEYGPCDASRLGIVEELLNSGCLPEWVSAECRFDACPEIRELFELDVE